MNNSTKKNDSSPGFNRNIIEWIVIGSVAALLYFTGWHTEVIGTLQQGMLWTGFFDADTTEIATIEGPTLSPSDYDFALQDEEGKRLSLSEFSNQVIFINVWASWCPPCVAEMPTIETLHESVGSDPNIKFILLSTDQKRQKAIDFMQREEFPMPYYFPASGIPKMFRSQYLPTTLIISKTGQIVYRKEGIADYSSPNFARWLVELSNK